MPPNANHAWRRRGAADFLRLVARDEVEELLPFTDNKGAIMPALLKVAMALVALSAVQSVAGAQKLLSRLSLYRRLFRS